MNSDLWESLARLGATFLFSLFYGLERQKANKPIGFGTFIFVSVGAAALALTAVHLNDQNPLPLLSAIVTGIGFLGAGALIRNVDRVFGFTSAATIWLFAIFGLVIGVGEYHVAAIVYGVVWMVNGVDRLLQRRGIGSYKRRLTIRTNRLMDPEEIARSLVQGNSFQIESVEIDRQSGTQTLTLLVEGTTTEIRNLRRKLFEAEWFNASRLE